MARVPWAVGPVQSSAAEPWGARQDPRQAAGEAGETGEAGEDGRVWTGPVLKGIKPRKRRTPRPFFRARKHLRRRAVDWTRVPSVIPMVVPTGSLTGQPSTAAASAGQCSPVTCRPRPSSVYATTLRLGNTCFLGDTPRDSGVRAAFILRRQTAPQSAQSLLLGVPGARISLSPVRPPVALFRAATQEALVAAADCTMGSLCSPCRRCWPSEYEVGPLLGTGSMGAVYQAKRRGDTDWPLAIKVLCREEHRRPEALVHRILSLPHGPCMCPVPRDAWWSEAVESARLEAGMLRRLAHAHVVPAIDYFETPDLACLVMPHMDWDLAKLWRLGPPTQEQAKHILRQVLLALVHMHRAGYAHCDLKPSNILVSRSLEVRVADLGLSQSPCPGADSALACEPWTDDRWSTQTKAPKTGKDLPLASISISTSTSIATVTSTASSTATTISTLAYTLTSTSASTLASASASTLASASLAEGRHLLSSATGSPAASASAAAAAASAHERRPVAYVPAPLFCALPHGEDKDFGMSVSTSVSMSAAASETTLSGEPPWGISVDRTATAKFKSSLSSKIWLLKVIALITSLINLIISLIVFILFDFSDNQFQFVQEYHEISSYDFYLGLDGLSIYFVLLTTIITPIALLSN